MCMTACIIVALGRVVGAGGLCVLSVLSGVFVVVLCVYVGVVFCMKMMLLSAEVD